MRINCAHDGVDEWSAMIANTRNAAKAVGRRVPVLMDIAGPKFRIGEVRRPPGARLCAGDRFRLVAHASAFDTDATIEAVCEPAEVLHQLAIGTEVSLDDGNWAASSKVPPRRRGRVCPAGAIEGLQRSPSGGDLPRRLNFASTR